MKSLYEDQKQEIDKAVVGIGEYTLSYPYLSYGVQAKDWFKKSQKQRDRILDRFGKAKLLAVPDTSTSTTVTGEKDSFTDEGNSSYHDETDEPCTSNPLQCTKLPQSIQQSMWAKVQSYLADESSYSKSPGVSDYTSVLVKSMSGERPHFVTKKATSYKCDSECLMFKSTNGICSHSLLVATLNGDVDGFVARYVKTKDPINYAALGQHGLPKGGKKASSRRKASSKKSTSAIKRMLTAADEITRTKRAAKTADPVPSLLGSSSFLSVSSPVYGVMANTVNFSAPPPPPLIHFPAKDSTVQHSIPSDSPVGQPFRLMFLNSRISRCQGCRGRIEQGQPSPGDIVLQHKEYVLFQNPRNGNWQMSTDLRNTYYHPLFKCIDRSHPGFGSSEICVDGDVREKLNPIHVSHIRGEFGLIL